LQQTALRGAAEPERLGFSMNSALFKRWKVSETLLRRAHEALPRPETDDPKFSALEKEFTEYLQHNEHELALNALEDLGDLVAARGGFWKDLMSAAKNMELVDRIPQFQKKHDEALSRPRRS
jgi:hypothetical protein